MAKVSSIKETFKDVKKNSDSNRTVNAQNIKSTIEKAAKENNDQIFKDLAKLVSQCIKEN